MPMHIHIDQDVAKRFWKRVSRNQTEHGCWLWTGPPDKWGYGRIRAGGKTTQVHRLAWTLSYGPIPEGMSIRHTCDVPNCVNPMHLIPGTHKDNMKDAADRNRFATGERHGSVRLSDEDVAIIRERKRNGELTSEIARDFGISARHARKLVAGTSRRKSLPST